VKAAILMVAMALPLAGCERGMHDMYDQKRAKPLAASSLFGDGRADRSVPDGIVPAARGIDAMTSSGREGDVPTTDVRPALSGALLARGRERYDIACAPCHSVIGDGDGFVVRRGFPRPESFHTDRLRDASDQALFDAVSDGYGVMAAFGNRLPASDRWAIVSYVRALQLAQHARIDDLTGAERRTLTTSPNEGPT
jgi:mono/diheme cytochrome c family protein